MHTRRNLGLALLVTCAVVGSSQLGCDYYVQPRAHGATYFGYPKYYYASAYRAPRFAYVPPATTPNYVIGGGPRARH
jgi:hypothetical protein